MSTPTHSADNNSSMPSAKMFELAEAMDEGVDIGRAGAEIDEYGIRNNHAFRRDGPIDVAQARHAGKPLGVVLADIDGLKYVNDKYGHPEGDKLIDRAKTVWQEIADEFDVPITVGRIGGDEFGALVHGNKIQTRKVAEEFEKRYQGKIEAQGHLGPEDIDCTTSIGFAMLSEETDSFAKLMREADEQMYKNKIEKLGELNRREKLALLAARGIIKLFTKKRLRDAPKYWRKMGILD